MQITITLRRTLLVVAALCLALGGIGLLALTRGTPNLSLTDLWQLLAGGKGDTLAQVIVDQLRLPRLTIGIMAGATLALVGVMLQDTLNNALAGPELLGVAAGATVVIATITVFSLPVAFGWYPILGLLGSLFSSGIVVLAARRAQNPVRVALVGAAVAAFLDAFMIGIIALGSQTQVNALYQYLAGSLAGRTWAYVQVEAPWAIISIPLALLSARTLNVLRLGDTVASGLGVRVGRTRILILLLAAAMTASVVAVCGPVSYVALLAPHLTRRLLGTADARKVLPVAALLGAALLTGADLLARLTFDPREMPVGLWTTIIGGPLVLLLLRQSKPGRVVGGGQEDNIAGRRGKHAGAVLGISAIVVAGLAVLHMGLGQVWITPGDVIATLMGDPQQAFHHVIIFDLRLPRTLIALITGAMLGVAGAIFQSVTRNPLAEPTFTGVSAGGVCVAALWVTLVPGAADGDWLLPIAALVGGSAAGGLVYALNWRGRTDPLQLILTGVLVSAIISSCTSLVLVLHTKFLSSIFIWVIGSLEGRAWAQWNITWPWALVALPLGLLSAGIANALALGDDIAGGLGLRVEWLRAALLAIAALLTAGAVAVVGAIGFISLIGPHIARRLVGTDARRVFPLSAVITAGLLVAADSLGETVGFLPLPRVDPTTQFALPVGAVTALLGAPFFLYLLQRRRRT